MLRRRGESGVLEDTEAWEARILKTTFLRGFKING